MTAKFYAARGFRRRSYDDQEGDNDINIILQPSDLDDIENEARIKYANYLTIAATTFSRIHHQAINHELATKNNATNEQTVSKTTSERTSAFKAPRSLAVTNIFSDMKLAKCLLDQDYNQTVRLFIEKSALNWNFNSFTFDALCCGRSLTELLMHLFDYYNLYTIFNLDIVKVLKCFRLLEFGYHSTNPYHNSVHAADVTQAMHCFIQENKIRRHMTNLEILCSILAAVCHDLDHPGVNQSFLVATNNPLARLYQNNSVLENHHWRFALCIFKEAKLFDHFSQDVLADMKEQLKHLILATDIARQNEYLKRFRDLTSSHKFSMKNTDDRALVLQMALKCADLGNPCRPWLISRVWSNLICDEFYRMGQIERRLGVPLTPICQREKTCIAGIQADFFRFIVLPLLELWHNFLESPLSNLLMSNFDHNYKRWQRANRIVQQLRRRKSVACLEPVPHDCIINFSDDDTGKENNQEDSNNISHDQCPRVDLSKTFDTKEKCQGNPSLNMLMFDSENNDYYYRHPISAIKRASSDYIKSGNGKLELLRDFQLDRIIERSPLIIRRKTVKLQQKHSKQEITCETSHKQSQLLGLGETLNLQKTMMETKTKNNCALQDLPSTKATTIITSTITNEPPHISAKKITTTTTTTNAPVAGLNQRLQQSNLSASCELVARQTSCIDHSQTSRWAQSSSSASSSSTAPSAAVALSSCSDGRQQLQTICSNYRKVLSPIEDGGEGPSPELRVVSQNGDGEKSANVDGSYVAPLNHGDVTMTKQKPQQPKATTSAFAHAATGPDTDISGSTSSSASRSISRASSACSSPVMQRSFSSRTSIDQSLSKHQHKRRQQQKQRTTQIQNHPFLAQYYEPSSGARFKQSNLSSTRQSVSNSKNMHNNRRRESDPGCLTDNYELAAAIVLIQYQNNSLFHKRRSSLPVCVPRRRSSK